MVAMKAYAKQANDSEMIDRATETRFARRAPGR
jgi:hypothetical protein